MIAKTRQAEIFNDILKSLNRIPNCNIEISLPILTIAENEIENDISKGIENRPDFDIKNWVNEIINQTKQSDQSNMVDFTNMNNYPDPNINSKLFDILGSFSSTEPDKVFLYDKPINRLFWYWQKQEFNKHSNWLIYLTENSILKDFKNLLIEIIYIHECAHYIHFHINRPNYLNWMSYFNSNKTNLRNEGVTYKEMWAQLLTERIIAEYSKTQPGYKLIFDRLLVNQNQEYKNHCQFLPFPEMILKSAFLELLEFDDHNQIKFNGIISHINNLLLEEINQLRNSKDAIDSGHKDDFDLMEDLVVVGHGSYLELFWTINNILEQNTHSKWINN
jgi:hypothetical protein